MKFSHSILLLIAVFVCSFNLAVAQTVKLNDKVSFSINNASVAEALDALTRLTGTAFSYNPDQLNSGKLIKVDMRDQKLIDVLEVILGPAKFGYRQMGNQIIIYSNKIDKEEDTRNKDDVRSNNADGSSSSLNRQNQNESTSNSRSNNALTGMLRRDTVFVVKEVHDTIRLTDIVVKIDTVYQKIQTPVGSEDIFHVVLANELTPVYKFDVGISGTIFLPHAIYSAPPLYNDKLKEYKESFSNKTFSGSAGIDLRVSYNRFTCGVGAILTLHSQKLDYNYLVQNGGYYLKDTLDPYYTLNGSDTTWYYIVDSAYVPVDNELFNYKINNHIKYLELPITVQYNIGYRSMLLFIKGGIIPGFFVGSDGQQIMLDNNGIQSMNEMKTKSMVLSYIAGAGIAIPLGRKTTFSTALSYRNHFSSIYKDFPIDTRFSSIGISTGIIYKLY